MSKSTKVKLFNSVLNLTEEFEIAHAERLLRMNNNGGWTLTEDSQFTFDENGFRIRENNKGAKNAREKGTDSKSDSTPK